MQIIKSIRDHLKVVIPVSLIGVLLGSLVVFALPALALSLPTSCNDASNEVIWCGAATPQQVVYDYNHGDGHNSVASIRNIYAYYGITASDINSMPSTAVAGVITKSGDVMVNNKIVATNALTGGREYIAGSKKVDYNGTIFYVRPPSVSFIPNELDAFVVMKNNKFEFAIISSCGNAVSAVPVTPPIVKPTPKPTPRITSPNYTIEKEVAVSGSRNFYSHIEVHPNTKVEYRILINSTGTAAVTNLTVKDIIPTDDSYVVNSLLLNNVAESHANVAKFFGGGLYLGTLNAGSKDIITYDAIAGANQNNSNCYAETIPNTAAMASVGTNLPVESSVATVSVVCVSIPATPITTTTTTIVTPTPKPAPTPTPTPTPKPAPAPTPVLTTYTTPTKLVTTGPGDVIGLFIAVSIVGTVGYGVYMRKRLVK